MFNIHIKRPSCYTRKEPTKLPNILLLYSVTNSRTVFACSCKSQNPVPQCIGCEHIVYMHPPFTEEKQVELEKYLKSKWTLSQKKDDDGYLLELVLNPKKNKCVYCRDKDYTQALLGLAAELVMKSGCVASPEISAEIRKIINSDWSSWRESLSNDR